MISSREAVDNPLPLAEELVLCAKPCEEDIAAKFLCTIPKECLCLASVFAQALSHLAVKGGSAHRAGCIPPLGDPGSCWLLLWQWELQVRPEDLFTAVKHLPKVSEVLQ